MRNSFSVAREGEKVWIEKLFGMPCAHIMDGVSPKAIDGLYTLGFVGRQPLGENGLRCTDIIQEETRVSVTCNSEDDEIQVCSRFDYDAETGVLSRRDTITNLGKKPLAVTKAHSKFAFCSGLYDVYTQASRWCNENEGSFRPLHGASVEIGAYRGRSCNGSTPFMALKKRGILGGLAFQLLPMGNFILRAQSYVPAGLYEPCAVIEYGLPSNNLCISLDSKETLEFSALLVYGFDACEQADFGAPKLHAYLQKTLFSNAKKELPVVYNTWFDRFDRLETQLLEEQLHAAHTVGCEAFVVDAGWYGNQKGDWDLQVGDWQEKTGSAFDGHMAEFAEKVREKGMRFGFWVEPERIGSAAPIAHQHPEWLVSVDGSYSYLKLWLPEVAEYLCTTIAALVRKYKAGWIKWDFNFDLGNDPTSCEFTSYYNALYKVVGEIKKEFPELVVEGCSSGGLRSDINCVSAFDCHFLSDTVDPLATLPIGRGVLHRMLPNRMGRWCVVRALQNAAPTYGDPETLFHPQFLVPTNAVWEQSRLFSLSFATLSAMLGPFGISGDLASFSKPALASLAADVALYKQWRQFIVSAAVHDLAGYADNGVEQDFYCYQYCNGVQPPASVAGRYVGLVFAFHLPRHKSIYNVKLKGINPAKQYSVEVLSSNRVSTLHHTLTKQDTLYFEMQETQAVLLGILEQ